MKRLLWSLVVAGVLTVLPAAPPADAIPVSCDDCEEQFPGDSGLEAGLRVWCEILTTVFCPWA